MSLCEVTATGEAHCWGVAAVGSETEELEAWFWGQRLRLKAKAALTSGSGTWGKPLHLSVPIC